MSKNDNKLIYSTIEFDNWANRKNLITQEKYLIETYFNKDGKTLEAGTGGGRILLEMKNMGFTSLYGFDFVPEFIEEAKRKDTTRSISFEVQDATSLSYEESFFDQVIYLQQLICFIEDDKARFKAVREAYRVLKPGGIALFSFLYFEVRRRDLKYLLYLFYIGILRKLAGSNHTIQYLPWLKLGGKFNFGSLVDRSPYVYWYKIQEAYQLLKSVGFNIVSIGSTRQITEGKMCETCEELLNEQIGGMLYFVCSK
ncbi:MAG: class I SAM-dependent methyltransferase [Candidatus Poribacteria bacterium]